MVKASGHHGRELHSSKVQGHREGHIIIIIIFILIFIILLYSLPELPGKKRVNILQLHGYSHPQGLNKQWYRFILQRVGD
jgi:hypothetical protein